MPQTFGAVLAALVAVAPGFVFTTVYRRNKEGSDPSEWKFFASSLVGSLPVHLVLIWWTLRLARIAETSLKNVGRLELAGWGFSLTLAVPIALGLLLSWLVDSKFMEGFLGAVGWSRSARTKSSWEWMFVPAKSKWLIVTLKDGSRVGGAWGKNSFASLEPTNRDLFIPRPHLINADKTFGAARGSSGLWIHGDDIVTIEAFDPPKQTQPGGD